LPPWSPSGGPTHSDAATASMGATNTHRHGFAYITLVNTTIGNDSVPVGLNPRFVAWEFS